MDTGVAPSPNKARKSMRSTGNTITTPSINESVSDATTPSVSNPVRKSARKSTGTRNIATNVNQANQAVSNRARSSTGISPNTTIPLSQPSCSTVDNSSGSNAMPKRTRSSMGISPDTTIPLSQPSCSRVDNSSDSDIPSSRTRTSLSKSLDSTLPFPKPGCSRDPDSSDSDISPAPTQKILRRKAPTSASKTSKKIAADLSSSSPPSTSEESENEEMLRKKDKKKNKTQVKVSKSSARISVIESNKEEKSLINSSNLVSRCAFYILVANQTKKAIKKRDILQHVFEGRNTYTFPEVLKKAASMLQKTFGFELMELKSSKNEYLLVNNLCLEYGVQEFAEYSRMERQKQGFIFYILTLIFMNENSMIEEELWKALDPLGIDIKSRKPHPVFGDVQKYITNTLVKQMYLERRQISKDPPQFELYWGERAHKEVLKRDLLEFVCKIMPETKPEDWILQYKDIQRTSPEGDAETEME